MKKVITLAAIFILFCSMQSSVNEAQLEFKNKSKWHLTVKVMQGTHKESTLHQEADIDPKSKHVFTFTETGKYYIKTMAVRQSENSADNDTLYLKENPFKVIASPKKGYSRIKLKFKIKTSRKASGNKNKISRSEFMKN